jgi:hypothetical protein
MEMRLAAHLGYHGTVFAAYMHVGACSCRCEMDIGDVEVP